ncbi:hypothetical protein BO79DRAFT_256639 [Aspergillus costaricaensis CBS 115574]|uniref:Uncharacterized protein n=1 Tax=Aspergillus costaricaensis CBS 115574 TaxID=1448317 RepID=A0ACD1IAW9_9EURO|nr:hypothetical protein BO79DRAFT_256639 [Aspergillus costaricaensis CBS 115574]RAK87145.1 hypothetical protein BO79DRAFT_256639 [Aspergillus costaricaensis CBS 115574]
MRCLIDGMAAHVPEDGTMQRPQSCRLHSACSVISEAGEFVSSTSSSIPFMPVTSLTVMITCAGGSNANLFLILLRDRVQMFMKNVVVKNLRHHIRTEKMENAPNSLTANFKPPSFAAELRLVIEDTAIPREDRLPENMRGYFKTHLTRYLDNPV